MSTRLFIGGAMDGKRMDVPVRAVRHCCYHRPDPMALYKIPYGSDPFEAITVVTESYTLRRFMCSGNEYEAFVLDGVTNPIEMLMLGYRKRPSRRKRR